MNVNIILKNSRLRSLKFGESNVLKITNNKWFQVIKQIAQIHWCNNSKNFIELEFHIMKNQYLNQCLEIFTGIKRNRN